jgi:hypothetical protein
MAEIEPVALTYSFAERLRDALVGIAIMVIFWFVAPGTSESDLLTSHARGAGLMIMIEQAIGWQAFRLLGVLAMVAVAWFVVITLWKFLDRRPEVVLAHDSIAFHPAILGTRLLYGDLTGWSYKAGGKHSSLTFHLKERRWSPQGVVPRRAVSVVGSDERLDPLVEFLSAHPAFGNVAVELDHGDAEASRFF